MKLRRQIRYIQTFFLTIFSFSYEFSNAAVPTEAIDAQIASFVNEILTERLKMVGASNFEVEIPKLDQRLKLSPCANDLGFRLIGDPLKQSRISVEISCPNPQGQWRIVRPIRVALYLPAITSKSMIPRGTSISRAQLHTKEEKSAKLRYGFYTEATQIIGMNAKRDIAAGTVLTPRMLTAPTLIKKGDGVEISARRGDLVVKAPGTAMSDGKKGQQILVRNVRSKRIVKAVVKSRGKVEIIF